MNFPTVLSILNIKAPCWGFWSCKKVLLLEPALQCKTKQWEQRQKRAVVFITQCYR